MTIYLGIPAPNYSFTQAIMYGFGMCGNGRMSIKQIDPKYLDRLDNILLEAIYNISSMSNL